MTRSSLRLRGYSRARLLASAIRAAVTGWVRRNSGARISGVAGCIRDMEHAYSKDGGLAVLYGNIAPEGTIDLPLNDITIPVGGTVDFTVTNEGTAAAAAVVITDVGKALAHMARTSSSR